MATQPDSREEALKRLDERLDALAAQRARKPMGFGAGESGAGYRLIGELIGGVLGGLGLGWLADRVAGTEPWGVLVGVLLGAGAAVFAVARSAGRMSAKADRAAANPPAAVPFDDEDDDGPPGGSPV